jgi:hypothetical protein
MAIDRPQDGFLGPGKCLAGTSMNPFGLSNSVAGGEDLGGSFRLDIAGTAELSLCLLLSQHVSVTKPAKTDQNKRKRIKSLRKALRYCLLTYVIV